MAYWVVTVSSGQEEWARAKDGSILGSDALAARAVRAGDELFVRSSDGTYLARCRVVGDPRDAPSEGEGRQREPYAALIPIVIADEPAHPVAELGALSDPLHGAGTAPLSDVVQIDVHFAGHLTVALSQDYRSHAASRAAVGSGQSTEGRGVAGQPIAFEQLRTADLSVDQTYLSGRAGHAGDDPLAVLLPVGNQGGFRYAGSPQQGTVRLVVLYTSGVNEDWPDVLDIASGTFTYYGDNRKPGSELHRTPRGGNQILAAAFRDALAGAEGRRTVPPFLLFERAGSTGRSVRFRGLMAPGSPSTPPDQQLIAVWRSRGGERFQNYRATFTVLDEPVISRRWLDQLLTPGELDTTGSEAPATWREWVEADSYRPLLAPPTTQHRSRTDQLPADASSRRLLDVLHGHFAGRPTDFEPCAAELFRMQAPAVESMEITRASRDGGRDAIGRYAIGPLADRMRLDFALEAKCYRSDNAVGVREVSRLISRLRHRQFGVLVTTSYVDTQAYKEIRQDGHPVVILSGVDIVAILKTAGLNTEAELRAWLSRRYPDR